MKSSTKKQVRCANSRLKKGNEDASYEQQPCVERQPKQGADDWPGWSQPTANTSLPSERTARGLGESIEYKQHQ